MVGCKGERERERRILAVEGSNTKLRIIRRFNLLVRQLLYMYVCVYRTMYNSNDGDYNIKVYL
jgi:hypothetical protein